MERLTQQLQREEIDDDAFDPVRLGTWPDRAAFGRSLAEDMGLTDYVWQIPGVLRPYVLLDYEAIARDMCQAGNLEVVEAGDGIAVFDRGQR